MRVVNEILNSNLSVEKISKKSGLSVESIRRILNGMNPSLKEVRKIAEALKVSIDYLISDSSNQNELGLMFRKTDSDKKGVFFDRFSYLVSNSKALLGDEYILGSFIDSFGFEVNNTYEGAEKLAKIFREKFLRGDFYSPLLNLPELIDRELNCILYVKDFGSEIDGASVIFDGVPYIFISPRFDGRMLFTLAHELGHVLAHHMFNENYLIVDEDVFRNSNSQEEYFCNSFASCLLLPSSGVVAALKWIRKKFGNRGSIGDIEILFLSRIFGISFEVAGRRCEDLDLLPKGGTASLYNILKKVHGSPEKRAEELGLPKRVSINFPDVPQILVNKALEKINSGELSVGRASELLSISIPSLVDKNSKATK